LSVCEKKWQTDMYRSYLSHSHTHTHSGSPNQFSVISSNCCSHTTLPYE